MIVQNLIRNVKDYPMFTPNIRDLYIPGKFNLPRNNQPFASVKRNTEQQRNEKCNCGSGKKFKHCHGK